MQKLFETGVKGLDDLFPGGLPKGSCILLTAPPKIETHLFCLEFVYRGSEHNEPGLFITMDNTPEHIKSRATAYGLDVDAVESKNDMYWIDGYSVNASKTVKNTDTITRVAGPMALTDTSITLTELQAKFHQKSERYRFAFDSLSTMLIYNSPESMYRFLEVIIAKIRSSGGIGFFVLGEGMHDKKVEMTLRHMMDGAITIDEDMKIKVISLPLPGELKEGWIELTDAGFIVNVKGAESETSRIERELRMINSRLQAIEHPGAEAASEIKPKLPKEKEKSIESVKKKPEEINKTEPKPQITQEKEVETETKVEKPQTTSTQIESDAQEEILPMSREDVLRMLGKKVPEKKGTEIQDEVKVPQEKEETDKTLPGSPEAKNADVKKTDAIKTSVEKPEPKTESVQKPSPEKSKDYTPVEYGKMADLIEPKIKEKSATKAKKKTLIKEMGKTKHDKKPKKNEVVDTLVSKATEGSAQKATEGSAFKATEGSAQKATGGEIQKTSAQRAKEKKDVSSDKIIDIPLKKYSLKKKVKLK